jgi:hypothetical protein
MMAAIFGLIGAAVGGLITGWFAYGLERRKDRASLQQAQRRVALELGRLTVTLDLVTRARSLALPDVLRGDVWRSEENVLARHLSDGEWEILGLFYLGIESLQQRIEAQPDEALSSEELQRVEHLIEAASRGRAALGAPPIVAAG